MAQAAPLSAEQFDAVFERISNWGRWGPDDQRGTLNFITEATARKGAALVQDGTAVSCALPLNYVHGPANPSPALHFMVAAADAGGGGSTDWLGIAFHGPAVTHLDALCHIFRGDRMYNGIPKDRVTSRGAGALTIEAAAGGIVSRSVLLDIPRSKGLDWLEPGEAITVADLEAAEEHHGVRVEEGDILLIRTGRHAFTRSGAPNPPPLPGPYPALPLAGLEWTTLPWLHDRRVGVLGGDNYSDVLPSGMGPGGLPIHIGAIAGMGLHLLDNADLESLGAACTARRRYAFLLTIAPLIIPTGTGSPVNPIALF